MAEADAKDRNRVQPQQIERESDILRRQVGHSVLGNGGDEMKGPHIPTGCLVFLDRETGSHNQQWAGPPAETRPCRGISWSSKGR
jgi:hypothetical protein